MPMEDWAFKLSRIALLPAIPTHKHGRGGWIWSLSLGQRRGRIHKVRFQTLSAFPNTHFIMPVSTSVLLVPPRTDDLVARSTASISTRVRKQRLVAWNACTAMEEIGNYAPTISSQSIESSLSRASSPARYWKPATRLVNPLADERVDQCRAYRDCKKAWVRAHRKDKSSVGHNCWW